MNIKKSRTNRFAHMTDYLYQTTDEIGVMLNHTRLAWFVKDYCEFSPADYEKYLASKSWGEIGLYELFGDECLMKISINLKFLVKKLKINVKKFADELDKFGYDLIIPKNELEPFYIEKQPDYEDKRIAQLLENGTKLDDIKTGATMILPCKTDRQPHNT